MALTIGEASAVNTLVRFLTQTSAHGEPPSSDNALEAAKLLVGKANKVLGAGLRVSELDALWKSVGQAPGSGEPLYSTVLHALAGAVGDRRGMDTDEVVQKMTDYAWETRRNAGDLWDEFGGPAVDRIEDALYPE